ncbi:bile acid:sodium symporter [Mesorhizobium sp. WSM3866]|uniref:bile acid:sodium symporter family protein n=1 Tax=Mesorhizobium sp. WSM3866 TaxID=422271 RepID=UPI000BAF7865|nr:bile acid:sodium symporter family protein [Mesorhizobium sp. WSM3866]PBB45256.1 bile acid:sodium symporter [Mesorhizobium sp. WSM3866]TJW06704.1 MAG: bile acid:sodium symporter family protein [Mesorhizobium sp.]WIE91878.1 bile acid:sodium symporter family protein [Mesorhizobium sp. WSM4875]
MQSSATFNIFLPVALVIIMLGLGLSLKLQDFLQVVLRPKALLVALIVQILVLPVLCFGIVSVSALPPAMAVGMMLLAASPGAPSAVLFTHLAKGDTALSLTLTAISSMVALVSVPLITNFSLLHFYGAGHVIPLPIEKFLQFFAVVLVPVSIGVAVRHRYTALAERLEGPVKLLATLFLAAVVIFAVVDQRQVIVTWGPVVGFAAFAFNVVSMALGYAVPSLLRLERRQAVAITMATAIHNAAFVIALALSEYLLNNAEMAIPPALYALIAYVTAAVFVAVVSRSGRHAIEGTIRS